MTSELELEYLSLSLYQTGLIPGGYIPPTCKLAQRDVYVPPAIEHIQMWEPERLVPCAGSGAAHYRTFFRRFARLPEDGWLHCEAQLIHDAWTMPWRPLTFYAGHPTDWPTGLVSWSVPAQPNGLLDGYPDRTKGDVQGPVFTLAVSRQR